MESVFIDTIVKAGEDLVRSYVAQGLAYAEQGINAVLVQLPAWAGDLWNIFKEIAKTIGF